MRANPPPPMKCSRGRPTPLWRARPWAMRLHATRNSRKSILAHALYRAAHRHPFERRAAIEERRLYVYEHIGQKGTRNDVHPANAARPITNTRAGRSTSASEVHPLKAFIPTMCKASPKVTLASDVQPSNAEMPMLSISAPSSTASRPAQPAKASSRISVTRYSRPPPPQWRESLLCPRMEHRSWLRLQCSLHR